MVLTATSLFYLRKCFPCDGGGSRETSGRVIRKDSEKEDKGYELKDEQLVGMAQPITKKYLWYGETGRIVKYCGTRTRSSGR